MEVKRITAKEYGDLFPHPFSMFNSVEFSELNRAKCLDVHYLIFLNNKIRLGIILGETDDMLKSPFSASYGGFSFNTAVPLQYYDEACLKLKEYAGSIGKSLRITLAPPLYDELDNAKTFRALMSAGATIESIDYNHHFDLAQFDHYEELVDSKTRNKLRTALSLDLGFEKLDSSCDSDVERAYRVIQTNHIRRGHPLRMSLQQVIDTIKVIPADFFIVTNAEGTDIAAAQIFHTSKDTVQVIYWGDIPDYPQLHSMNFLSYKVFEYYHSSTDIKCIDIGISTEEGTPNYGLCAFKENVGCNASTRFTLKL